MKKTAILIYLIVGSMFVSPAMGACLYKICISPGHHIELEHVFHSHCSSSFEEKETCTDIPISCHTFVPSTNIHRSNQFNFAKLFINLESLFSLDVNISSGFSSCKFPAPSEHITVKSTTVLLI